MNDLLLLSMMLESPKYGYQLKKEAGFIMGQALHNNLVYPSLRRFLASDRVISVSGTITRDWHAPLNHGRALSSGQQGQSSMARSGTRCRE